MISKIGFHWVSKKIEISLKLKSLEGSLFRQQPRTTRDANFRDRHALFSAMKFSQLVSFRIQLRERSAFSIYHSTLRMDAQLAVDREKYALFDRVDL